MARPRITPANARRALIVAKVVVPLMAPFAMRAAGYARHRWDTARARRLGVGLDELASFSGKGKALHARLSRLAISLHELAERRPQDAEFVRETDSRLADLAAAMRAAELMPTARRRPAHKAVATELDALEAELLRRLGVNRPQ
jgi:hypothetical protein